MRKRNFKRAAGFVLTVMLLLQTLTAAAVFTAFAAPDTFFRAVTSNSTAVTAANGPDGQTARRVNFGDGLRITANNQGNLADVANSYFVMDIWTGGAEADFGGNFAITRQSATGGWWGQQAHFFGLSVSPNDGSGWATLSAHISLENAAIEGGSPADLSILSAVNQLGFSWNKPADWPDDYVIFANPRFQSTPNSARPVPSLDIDTRTVTAAAPSNGQAVEFAVNTTGLAPTAASGWTAGTLSGENYTHTFASLPEGSTYYVFARAAAGGVYTTAGISIRTAATTMDDDDLIAEAADLINWSLIRGTNANTDAARQNVTANLVFPSTVGTGVNAVWSTSNPAAISGTGVLNRLHDRENNKNITITATLSLGTGTPVVRTVEVRVLAVPAATVSRVAGNFPNTNEYTALTAANGPDGQTSMRLGNGRIGAGAERIWDARFIGTGAQNLIDYADKYFVFEMLVTSSSALQFGGNNWIAMATQNNGNSVDSNSRIRLNESEMRAANVGEWFTVYAHLASSNSPNNFNPAFMDNVQAGRLQMQWPTAPSGDLHIRNPRFQPTADSPLTTPAVTSISGNTITISAPVPATGQAVEFARTLTGAAPSGSGENAWVTGTLSDCGTFYSAERTMPASGGAPADSYYVFARAVQNTTYPFTSTHTRVLIENLEDAEAVSRDLAAVFWEDEDGLGGIRGHNAVMSEVRTELILPLEGRNGTTITWTAVPAGVIDTLTGEVTRHEFDDIPVSLTATVSRGEASGSKTFNLVVSGLDNELAELFIDFNDPSTFSMITGMPGVGTGLGDGGRILNPTNDDVPAWQPVPGRQGAGLGVPAWGDGEESTLTTATQSGVSGLRIDNFMYVVVDSARFANVNIADVEITWWRPSATGGLGMQFSTIYAGTFSGVEGYRSASIPTAGSGNNWVTSRTRLNGVNFRHFSPHGGMGPQNHGAHFRINTGGAIIRSIKIIEVPPTDTQAVALALDALIWDTIKGANIDQTLVASNLQLPATGANRTNITWTSSNPDVLSSDGTINRQPVYTPVTLTALIEKGGMSASKDFNLIIRRAAMVSDEEAVNKEFELLDWNRIKGVNTSISSVSTNLTLPSEGYDMAGITWTSSNTNIIGNDGAFNNDNTDTVIAAREAGGTVTLTATIARGDVSLVKDFVLTVPGRYNWVSHTRQALNSADGAKDWAVSDFNVLGFGAMSEEMIAEALVGETDPVMIAYLNDFCNRVAFQAAIDAAYEDGGGVVYAPAGTYAFRTEVERYRDVEQREGSGSDAVTVNRRFYYNQVLYLQRGVQLRGDWTDPGENGENGVSGTILAVYAGHGSDNFDTYVPTSATESQTGQSVVANVSDRFIHADSIAGVTNLSVWYPNQDITAKTQITERNAAGEKYADGRKTTVDGVPYPWTFVQASGNGFTIDNVTLVNAWGGFISFPTEMHYVLNSYMTALYSGVRVHTCTDIGRIENVTINPGIWANSGLAGAPSFSSLRTFTRANSVGMQMHRSDWEFVSGLRVTGYNTGMWIGREPGRNEAPNGQIYGVYFDDCVIGLDVDRVNGFGMLISNSVIGGDTAANFRDGYAGPVQFNGVEFRGPIINNSTSTSGQNHQSFENCIFNEVAGGAVLRLTGGNAIINQSRFMSPTGHGAFANAARQIKVLNSGYGENPEDRVFNYTTSGTGSNRVITVANGPDFIFEPMPGFDEILTDIPVYPRPSTNNILRVDLPRGAGINGGAPSIDVSAQLQSAIDYVRDTWGSGTVFIPGGRYLVNNPIVVHEGIELRGTWDVQHHTQGGGTALFTRYRGVPGSTTAVNANGQSFITLKKNAGLSGILLNQFNITGSIDLTVGGASNQLGYEAPFMVQGQGHGVYAVNLTINIADRGIDFGSYDTSGHYIQYYGGAVLRDNIVAGGGAVGGFIRNMQFNPHFPMRAPGGQGYQSVGGDLYAFIQRYGAALVFGDVKEQTIFNNFVYGSVYGVRFRRDPVTGKTPGEITMIGHGSDGTTFAFYVEDADADTKIIAINSELVNTNISTQPVRSYVLVGGSRDVPFVSTTNNAHAAYVGRIHPDAQLILYNTAFWGSPTVTTVINGGNVSIQQANFTQMGFATNAANGSHAAGMVVLGGSLRVVSSYFNASASGSNTYVRLRATGGTIEMSSNRYATTTAARLYLNDKGSNNFDVFGSDIFVPNAAEIALRAALADAAGLLEDVNELLLEDFGESAAVNAWADELRAALPLLEGFAGALASRGFTNTGTVTISGTAYNAELINGILQGIRDIYELLSSVTFEAAELKAALEQVSALLDEVQVVLAKPRGTNMTANLWANALTAFVPRLADFAEANEAWDGEETVEIDGITFAAADVNNWVTNVRNIYNLLNAIV